MNTSQPPIGYVVKQLDRALTALSDAALQQHGLDRVRWQILNSIGDGASIDQVASIMRPFLEPERVVELVGELQSQDWVASRNHILVLTAQGSDRLQAAGRSQGSVRDRLTAGISEDEYGRVIATLQRMLQNLS